MGLIIRGFVCLLLSGFYSFVLASELVNENLLMNLPLPEGEWEMTQGKVDKNTLENRWTAIDGNAMLQVFILYNQPESNPELSKQSDMQIGQKHCDKLFESENVLSESQYGYPQLIWYTECKTSAGFYSKSIHKVIVGKDSRYEIKKIFYQPPNLKRWQLWLDYLSEISVCDSRDETKLCPQNIEFL